MQARRGGPDRLAQRQHRFLVSLADQPQVEGLSVPPEDILVPHLAGLEGAQAGAVAEEEVEPLAWVGFRQERGQLLRLQVIGQPLDSDRHHHLEPHMAPCNFSA